MPHTILGTSSRSDLTLSLEDRVRHLAVVGATGSGKSNLLRHIARQDIGRGDGLLVLDPLGDLSAAILGDIPQWRWNHVCFLNAADFEQPVGLNVLEDTQPDDRARVVDGFVSAMRSVHYENWGPRLETILRHGSTALIETGGSLVLMPQLLIDDEYRRAIVSKVTNHETREFFGKRFEKWRDTFRDEAIDPVLNKVEAFLAFPSVRMILGQTSTLDLQYAMNNERIVIVNLAMGVIGETASRLMGALILAHVRAAAMARASIPVEERKPFHLIADEVHSFGPASVARLLQETRQYRLSVTLATQFLDALAESTRSALLGNAKTLAAFRCGPGDAQVLAQHFARLHQAFNETALLELDDGEAVISAPGREATHVSVPPPQPIRSSEAVRKQSRRHYGRPRIEVERYIARKLGYSLPN